MMGSKHAEKKHVDDLDPYGHPRIPLRGYYDVQRCNQRREWAEKFAACSLHYTGQWWEGEGENDSCSCLKLKGNIENVIGLVKVPLGLVGPLLIKGSHVNGYVLCPFATTEGALVASATRGATALTRAGGVYTKVLDQTQIRSPSFQLRSMQEVDQLIRWLDDNFAALQKQVHLFSQHANLVDLTPTRQGRLLIMHFKFHTKDAAGQNMVTSSTWQLCKWLLRKIETELPSIQIINFWIESNMSGDKKVAFLNLMRTRGLHAQAEAWIPESILKSVLKVSAKALVETNDMLRNATIASGAIGYNANVANILAAVFIATGQDVACIAESASCQLFLAPARKDEIISQGRMFESAPFSEKLAQLETHHTTISDTNGGPQYDGIYACIDLPSLILGTVGGGTALATQKESLNLMGCYGKDGVSRLGEIIASFALGLELSTISAVASGQFATAHERLGRNRPTHGLRDEHLNKEFFSKVLGDKGTLVNVTAFSVNTGNSILSELTKSEMSKKVGHFGFNLTYKDHSGSIQVLPVVVKSKPLDTETCNMVNKMAQGCGLNLAILYEQNKNNTGFKHCSVREVEICRLANPIIQRFMPNTYSTLYEPSKDLFVIVMELLTKENFALLNTADDTTCWKTEDIKVVLRDLARVHSLYLGNTKWLGSKPWLEKKETKKTAEMAPLWRELLRHAHSEFPEFWPKDRMQLMDSAITNLQEVMTVVNSAPQTMTHNDCNPRNICLRLPHAISSDLDGDTQGATTLQVPNEQIVPYSDPRITCLYDWELATIDVPQHDLAEFLSFVLQPSTPLATWLEFMDFYRQHLQFYSGVEYPKDKFVDVFNSSTLEFAINRLLMYTMAHTYKDYLFLPRVVNSLFSYISAQVGAGKYTILGTFKAKL